MKWTKKKPTKEGWYWVRNLLVDFPFNRVIVLFLSDKKTKNIIEYEKCEFKGPIPEPEE